jgi:hypothetical protein
MPRSARAQLYVVEYYAGKVSEYDATTGAAINRDTGTLFALTAIRQQR